MHLIDPSSLLFCHTCQALVAACNYKLHSQHNTTGSLSALELLQPTLLLQPKDNNKSNAQYLFADSSVKEFMTVLRSLNLKRVLCVGLPRLHEAIQLGKMLHEATDPAWSQWSSVLLDWDSRYGQFYKDTFVNFNMFNGHIFPGKETLSTCKARITSFMDTCDAIVVDPPFGGVLGALYLQLKQLSGQSLKAKSGLLPIFFCFPYFNEKDVSVALPELKMSDWKLDYRNHSDYHVSHTFNLSV